MIYTRFLSCHTTPTPPPPPQTGYGGTGKSASIGIPGSCPSRQRIAGPAPTIAPLARGRSTLPTSSSAAAAATPSPCWTVATPPGLQPQAVPSAYGFAQLFPARRADRADAGAYALTHRSWKITPIGSHFYTFVGSWSRYWHAPL